MSNTATISKELTLNELLSNIGAYHWQIIGSLILFTALTTAIAYGLKKAKKNEAAAKFLCPPIFAVTLPGVLFTLILLYMILFTKDNILNAPLLILFIPLWFGITLIFSAKVIDFDQIPGFDKISGLITFSGLTFLALLILLKLKIILLTFLSPLYAIGIVIALYTIWRKGFSKMFGKKDQ